MKRIAIDMDEVTADTFGGRLKRYNKTFSTSLQPNDFTGKRVFDVIPEERRDLMKTQMREPGFFVSLDVIEGAQEVVRELSEHYEVFIVTAAMEVPTSFSEKYIWLRTHFPFIDPMNYVFCGHKFVIAADYLIDDHVRHFETFPGEGILFGAPHNASEEGYRRVRSWAEVRELFLNELE